MVFKGFGLLVMGFGVVILVRALIGTVFFDAPMNLNGRPSGKMEAVAFPVGLPRAVGRLRRGLALCCRTRSSRPQAVLAADSGGRTLDVALGQFLVGLKAGSPLERSNGWRSIAGGGWSRRQAAGKRRAITGPMSSFESAWAVRASPACWGSPPARGVARIPQIYPCVPTVDPAVSPGSTLTYRLSRSDRPWHRALGCLAATLFWNAVTWVFVWVRLSGGMDRPGGRRGKAGCF